MGKTKKQETIIPIEHVVKETVNETVLPTLSASIKDIDAFMLGEEVLTFTGLFTELEQQMEQVKTMAYADIGTRQDAIRHIYGMFCKLQILFDTKDMDRLKYISVAAWLNDCFLCIRSKEECMEVKLHMAKCLHILLTLCAEDDCLDPFTRHYRYAVAQNILGYDPAEVYCFIGVMFFEFRNCG